MSPMKVNPEKLVYEPKALTEAMKRTSNNGTWKYGNSNSQMFQLLNA